MDSADLRKALAIISLHPRWVESFLAKKTYFSRLVLPSRHGRLRVVGPGVMYTWARLRDVVWALPGEEHWMSEEGALWLMDLVWDPAISARRAVEIAAKDAAEQGIAKDGEIVLFWRETGRFGAMRFRAGAQTDGDRPQNADGRE